MYPIEIWKIFRIFVGYKITDMTSKDFIDIISSVGFPIAMCAAMFYYMIKENEKHQKEVKELSDTIANNTTVLMELQTLIKTLVK